ncbi:unnamed protein product [Acanthosepion pharaonis]|uniref:Uncharacterized protein n=1 Tax=Acanthosepion pharaonis TaxID=158019 RepID=A0A812AVN1_ACAPH|nr:unnamed protein product [Sepia pharaonis]
MQQIEGTSSSLPESHTLSRSRKQQLATRTASNPFPTLNPGCFYLSLFLLLPKRSRLFSLCRPRLNPSPTYSIYHIESNSLCLSLFLSFLCLPFHSITLFLSLYLSFYISKNLSCIFLPPYAFVFVFLFRSHFEYIFREYSLIRFYFTPPSLLLQFLFFSFSFLVRHPSTPDLFCHLSVSLFLHVLGVAFRLPYTINPKCHLLSFLSRGIRSEWRVSGSSYPAFLGLIFFFLFSSGSKKATCPATPYPSNTTTTPYTSSIRITTSSFFDLLFSFLLLVLASSASSSEQDRRGDIASLLIKLLLMHLLLLLLFSGNPLQRGTRGRYLCTPLHHHLPSIAFIWSFQTPLIL